MWDLANGAVRLIDEDVDVTGANLAKEMLESSFDKVIPIMDLQEDSVANGHRTPKCILDGTAYPAHLLL